MWTVLRDIGVMPVTTGLRRVIFRWRGRSALADPAERRLGLRRRRLRRRLVLAVTPRAAGAVVVMPLPARKADHVSIVQSGADLYGCLAPARVDRGNDLSARQLCAPLS
jgi:hypothetical protein